MTKCPTARQRRKNLLSWLVESTAVHIESSMSEFSRNLLGGASTPICAARHIVLHRRWADNFSTTFPTGQHLLIPSDRLSSGIDETETVDRDEGRRVVSADPKQIPLPSVS